MRSPTNTRKDSNQVTPIRIQSITIALTFQPNFTLHNPLFWDIKCNVDSVSEISMQPPASILRDSKSPIPEHSNNHSHRHDHVIFRNCPSSHVVHTVYFYKQNLTVLRSHMYVWEAITNTCNLCMWGRVRDREREWYTDLRRRVWPYVTSSLVIITECNR
jgi:hypothetical protein